MALVSCSLDNELYKCLEDEGFSLILEVSLLLGGPGSTPLVMSYALLYLGSIRVPSTLIA